MFYLETLMSTRRKVPGIRQYDGAAGGWGALRATARAIRDQMDVDEAPLLLYRTNKPTGFDCPGCAWPDKEHTSTFQFCENGAKAVTWEATKKRVTNEFFAAHTVSALLEWTDYDLENEGRLTHPMAYDRGSDTYQPISWDEAFARIGQLLRDMPDPNAVEFYTSGRASNEAAFLYQLFAREYGTNNFPDCSNMCHEATSVGLPLSIGIGKGTVSLDDFDRCELIIAMGHNPGTNHPRMMGTLHEASRRGVPIIVFNPLKERALERFADPQNPVEMTTLGSTRIASSYYQVKVGGDAAALKGIMKALIALDDAAGPGSAVLDHEFIAAHTHGFAALADGLARYRMGGNRGDERIVARIPSGRCRRVCEVERHHHQLRNGHHTAHQGNFQCAADRQFIAVARQLRQAGRRNLSVARPLQCARRPHRRYYREAECRAVGGTRARVRHQTPACSWS